MNFMAEKFHNIWHDIVVICAQFMGLLLVQPSLHGKEIVLDKFLHAIMNTTYANQACLNFED